MYASKLFTIIKKHLPNVHCFADDTQLYLSFKSDGKSSLDEAISAMNRCISDLRNWMIRESLMINDDKTDKTALVAEQYRSARQVIFSFQFIYFLIRCKALPAHNKERHCCYVNQLQLTQC